MASSARPAASRPSGSETRRIAAKLLRLRNDAGTGRNEIAAYPSGIRAGVTHTRLIFAALLAAVSVGASIGSKRTGADGGPGNVRVVFALEGPPIDGKTPGGRVVYESNRRGSRLRVVARNVDLPKGTMLIVRVDGLRAGLIYIGLRGNGSLVLRSKDGEDVPRVGIDSMVEVRERFTHRLVLSNETPGGTASHALWVVPRMPVTFGQAMGRRAA